MSGFAKKGSSAAGSLVAAPKTLRYEHDGGLPVAIEAKSNRRAYVPNNGSTFSPGQAENAGEMYNEIRKCFGTIGSYNHGTMLNKTTFTPTTNNAYSYAPDAGHARHRQR